jgi:hypothetical protein
MVKLARDNRKIYPDLIYVWTWRPDEYWGWTKYQYATESKYRTEKLLYKKHICGLGFFSRYHVRRTITLLLGVDANLYIHTIKGKNLIKQGITDLPKKGHQSIFFKGKPTKIRRFIFPAEARMDKHRRRHFVVRMNKIYKKHGRRAFNKAYQIALYGYRDEFSPEYRKQKRLQVHSAILQEIQQAESRRKESI